MIKDKINQILQEIEQIRKRDNLDYAIQLIAVTKYATIDQIKEVLAAGIFNLGESRVQDLLNKKAILNDQRIKWHFIGNLQTNKVKKLIEHVDLIHSGSSIKLLNKINDEAKHLNRKIPVLLQINVAKEKTKSGFTIEDFLLNLPEIFSFENLEIKGIMFIAPYTKDEAVLTKYFVIVKNLYNLLKTSYNSISELSIGMSSDYLIALNEGATMIRIGSLLFN